MHLMRDVPEPYVRNPFGRGRCARYSCSFTKTSQLVEDVHQFPGTSRATLHLTLRWLFLSSGRQVVGVLDIIKRNVNGFAEDLAGLEQVVKALEGYEFLGLLLERFELPRAAEFC